MGKTRAAPKGKIGWFAPADRPPTDHRPTPGSNPRTHNAIKRIYINMKQSPHPHLRHCALTILLGFMLLFTATGCEPETRIIRSSWDSLPADPKPRNAGTPGNTDQRNDPYQDPAGGQGWAIQVTQITGSTRHDEARDLVQELRTQSGLSDFWIEDLNNTATIYHGRFKQASDPGIRDALASVQQIQIDGVQPYIESSLIPLVGQGRAIADPFDLRQFIGYYSLQIGFYDAAFEGDFRAAAEQAVRVLREDGHDAYYYHGPYRSILAIGVFSYEQAFVRAGATDTYAPQVRALQKTFPFNLGNGATIIQKEAGRNIGEQKSSLIRVF